MLANILTEAEISHRLAAALDLPVEEDCSASWLTETPRPAAVLIPFLRRESEWHLLFTRRTDRVEHHKGQVSFPGGRRDPGDPSPQFTALRESEEEIGLRTADVNILGVLPELPTVTNYCVTPVVGAIPWPYPLQLAEEEVSRVFTIPLAWLADPIHRVTRTQVFFGLTHSRSLPVIYFDIYDGELLWGVSAQITLSLLKALSL